MTIEILLSQSLKGYDPFDVFERIRAVDQDQLLWKIRRMPYTDFLRTLYWFAVSSVAKSKAGMRCQTCNETAMISAHHRTYDCHGREHVSLNDLTCLCDPCHKLFHGRMPRRPDNPAIEAQSIVAAVREALAVEGKVGRRRRRRGFEEQAVDHKQVEADMPPGDGPIVLTRQLIKLCRTDRGGFTNATLLILGVRASTRWRWPKRIAGTTVSRDDFRRALEGRYAMRTGPLPDA